MILLKDSRTRSKFIFLNSIRISILSALIIFSLFVSILFELPFPIGPIILSLFIAVFLSILNFPLFKILKYRLAIYIQLLLDIIIITILVYFSGGIESSFYFLYILPIIVSSIFLTKRDTIYIATLSYIVFGVLSNLMYLEIIPIYHQISMPDISRGKFIYNMLMSFFAFSSIALISSYYFEKIRRTGAELKNVQDNLKDLILLNNTVFEKMENGFITCDSDGTVISYNEKSKDLLKLNSSSNIFELLFEDSDLEEIIKVSQLNSKYYLEKKVNNLILGISVSFIEKIYAFDKLFVFIITDLTEKRQIEQRLKEKEHLALIGEMSAGIAHEIRNPLASISGSVQFLKKELKLDTENKKLMNIIVKESNRLSKSVEEFLDFTKTTPLKKSEFNLSSLLDDIIDLIGFINKEINLIKKYNKKNFIYADRKKINQLIWNLINNSVKALSGKGNVEISIYLNDNNINLSIKDNGIGIEKGELSKIFVPFYSKFSSGIGLGMAIVKRIADEHDLEIKMNSKKNIGTEVIVCFKKI